MSVFVRDGGDGLNRICWSRPSRTREDENPQASWQPSKKSLTLSEDCDYIPSSSAAKMSIHH